MIGFPIIICDSKRCMLGFKPGPSRLAQPMQSNESNSNVSTKEDQLHILDHWQVGMCNYFKVKLG